MVRAGSAVPDHRGPIFIRCAMSYITREDIDRVYGRANVNTWADLDGDGSVNEETVDDCISVAEAEVDDIFRDSVYAVPLVATAQIKRWAATLAGFYLYSSRGLTDDDESPGGKLAAGYRQAVMDMERAAVGEISLGGQSRDVVGPDSPVIVT